MPEHLRSYWAILEKKGAEWGATPLMSKEQKESWDYFYENCIQMYSDDINKVIRYLQSKLERFYDYVDVINEPGCSATFHAKALFKSNRDVEVKKLCKFYEYVINHLPVMCKIIVEPFNYDVS